MALDGSTGQAPPSLPMGTRLMASTPPPTANSASPDFTLAAAMFTASRPEAQKRLIWTPATDWAQPALSTAVRAMSAPCSPTGETQPRMTSSTREVSSPLRSRRASSTWEARLRAVISCRLPSFLPLPRGVRTAS